MPDPTWRTADTATLIAMLLLIILTGYLTLREPVEYGADTLDLDNDAPVTHTQDRNG